MSGKHKELQLGAGGRGPEECNELKAAPRERLGREPDGCWLATKADQGERSLVVCFDPANETALRYARQCRRAVEKQQQMENAT